MSDAVQLEQVAKHYGRRAAVNRVTLSVGEGERLALLGHNGAGKTTLMKLLLGLSRPDGGRVRVLGSEPAGRSARRLRRSIGFLPENLAFDPALSGRELLRFYARLKGRRNGECDTLLQRVGLQEAADQRVGTWSKGMRQRLGLAQALLGRPRLLLLDEPTTGLDPLLRLEFYAILHELSAAGTTVLLSSHALTEVEERTERIAIMRQGRLVALGPLADLRADAGLPLRLQLRVAETRQDELLERLVRHGARGDGRGRLSLECPPGQKLALLRELAATDGVLDLDLDPPSLDEVYAHFIREAA